MKYNATSTSLTVNAYVTTLSVKVQKYPARFLLYLPRVFFLLDHSLQSTILKPLPNLPPHFLLISQSLSRLDFLERIISLLH
ncbi:hypothetical protein Csa_014541 [Cucumis sativus]|uniref:Uncharacterized protein n=1 Tax=Cucumis sativus TaxID=3659 RepID=A0A0A0KXR6_CUCSA|nr:hypothetical protein Csa_014541 [Cucumis sativus]